MEKNKPKAATGQNSTPATKVPRMDAVSEIPDVPLPLVYRSIVCVKHHGRTGATYQSYKEDPLEANHLKLVTHLVFGMTGSVMVMEDTRKSKDNRVIVKMFYFQNLELVFIRNMRELFLNETSILQRLDHTNIVNSVVSVIGPTYAAIVLDYIPDGPLHRRVQFLEDSDIPCYFIQIASALRYMHGKHVIHRDVKLNNIILNGDTAMLTDFGLSMKLPPHNPLVASRAGTKWYYAPECLNYQTGRQMEFNGYKADSYSLGVCLWSILMKQEPNGEHELMYKLNHKVKELDAVLANCARRLLTVNPDERACISQLLSDLARSGYRQEELESLACSS